MGVSQSLWLSETGYDIASNTSTVRIVWSSTQSGGSFNSYERTAKYWVSINGGDETEYSVSYTLPQATTISIVDTTITVNHETDGTGTVSVRTWMDTHISAGVVTKSESLTLTTIPRASDLNVSNGTLGVKQTITANKKNSGFTHTLAWKSGSYSGIIDEAKVLKSIWEFTPSLDLATGSPNWTSVYCEFTLSTYKGNSLVGSVSKTVTMAIPDSVVPTCSVALSDKKGYFAKFGGYVQGQSILHGVITANGVYGSKISSYSTSVNSSIYSGKTFDTDTLLYSGNNTVRTQVRDSRGRIASVENSIHVLSYSTPKITKLSVIRCNDDGTENDQGSHAKVTYSYSITYLNSLTDNNNSKGAVLKYKKSSESETAWQSIPLDAKYIATDETRIIDADSGSSYDIALFVSDDFYKDTNAVKSQTSVSTGYCIYHVPASGKGITFGGIAESDGFNVKMPATFSGSIKANGNYNGRYVTGTWLQTTEATDLGTKPHKVAVIDDSGWIYSRALSSLILEAVYPVGSIYMSVNSTSPATLFGGTWKAIQGKFLLGADGNTYKAGNTGGEAAHTLTESEMPSHKHSIWFPNDGGEQSAAIGYPDTGSKNTYYAEASKTSGTGGGSAHNNMPPYLSVYIWKRTA
jgi:hypothetical protein